jgi:hypothetical protein
VDIVIGSGEKRLEDKGLGAARFELAITIDTYIAFAGFSAS